MGLQFHCGRNPGRLCLGQTGAIEVNPQRWCLVHSEQAGGPSESAILR
jgi:hypothetical protein